jgi:predicted house-cleaning noncanonical NTP pyrophosphatase (MazG superfamily)
MTSEILFSEKFPLLDWTGANSHKVTYGPKGAMLMALPRAWVPPYVLLPASIFHNSRRDGSEVIALGKGFVADLRSLAGTADKVIVRSSVIGESIWERGKYQSIVIDAETNTFERLLREAVAHVLATAQRKEIGLVLQRYVKPVARGEFGNLLRVSKTRDHWELSTDSLDGTTSRIRLNTQRDEAAAANRGLDLRVRLPRERLFGSIGAWLNNVLLRGRSKRLNCEWVADNERVYLLQIDEEDEDSLGVNPYQFRVPAFYRPSKANGVLLQPAAGKALREWDKLKVLNELWEPDARQKPTLFYVALAAISSAKPRTAARELESDFRSLIGPNNIVVRTSNRAGTEKLPNLPRTECLDPTQAAEWCLQRCSELKNAGVDSGSLAFVAHRFIASRASAWARAAPNDPAVDIHCLWGLPDALQYCPYDIWEVHLPTEVATDYPEYKSNILIPTEDGRWEYVRVRNDLARNLSIGRREAMDIAMRTAAIAQRLGRACHVMWFADCVSDDGTQFNMPWYWIEAHDAQKNVDRTNYRIFPVVDPPSLSAFRSQSGPHTRQAIELKPTSLDLMRDTNFIESVGKAAAETRVPVILAGSTLAHAYYQLRREGCTVLTPGEKEHSRVRRAATFGKLVRDKIPTRIAERREAEITRKLPNELVKGFLTSKLLEEAMEVRSAASREQKSIELADLYEVVRALAQAEGIAFDEIIAAAEIKKKKAGGFESGLVLIQTGILGRDSSAMQDADRPLTQVLANQVSGDIWEIPFSFFGFMEIDQARSLVFPSLAVKLDVILKHDRIQLQLSKQAEQLELPLDFAIEPAAKPLAKQNVMSKKHSRKSRPKVRAKTKKQPRQVPHHGGRKNRKRRRR